jgi:4-amino-4-deoxy-L-arabinose transferase-like glycosyltransferase
MTLDGDNRWRLCATGVLLLTSFLFFARLGDRALWSMELRWAEIPREMCLNDNYFWPTINGREYYDKPLGSYWLVLAASRLTGGVNETAARLPCALCGLLDVLLLMLLARHLYDGRTAVLAGFVLATSFSFVFFARHASADVENVTGELAALLLCVRNEKRPGGAWVVGLWLIMAATSLTKGLLGFALPLLVLGAYSSFRGGRLVGDYRWLFNRTSLLAVPLALGVYFLPFVISHLRMGSGQGLAMVYRENLQRFFQPVNHRGPVYLYAYVVFGLMAPWSVFLPAALVHAHRRDDEGPGRDWFALVFFWATFAFFTASASRRSYYLLPILPAGALLVARLLTTSAEALGTAARRLLRAGHGLLALVVVLTAAAFLPPARVLPEPWAHFPPVPERLWFGGVWVVCLAAAACILRGFCPTRVALSTGVIAFSSLVYLFVAALPAAEAYRDDKTFARRVRARLGSEVVSLALYRTRELVFYLNVDAPLPEYSSGEDLRKAFEDGRVRWVLLRQRDLAGLELPRTVIACEAVYPWEGTEQRANKMVLIRLGTALPVAACGLAPHFLPLERGRVSAPSNDTRGADATPLDSRHSGR